MHVGGNGHRGHGRDRGPRRRPRPCTEVLPHGALSERRRYRKALTQKGCQDRGTEAICAREATGSQRFRQRERLLRPVLLGGSREMSFSTESLGGAWWKARRPALPSSVLTEVG